MLVSDIDGQSDHLLLDTHSPGIRVHRGDEEERKASGLILQVLEDMIHRSRNNWSIPKHPETLDKACVGQEKKNLL